MSAKLELKNIAINLRKRGYSYRDILKVIKVSKSSLSLWLKDIKLSDEQQHQLNNRVENGHLLGAKASRDKRVLRTKVIKDKAISEIGIINKKEMLMLGAMLYWGEGSKQSVTNISQQVEFVNSDPKMCNFFIKWVTEIIGVNMDRLVFRVYINESKKIKSDDYKRIWSKMIGVPPKKLNVYFTKDRYSNLKRSSRESYKGQLRIVVNKSTDLNRKIAGWVEGICLKLNI